MADESAMPGVVSLWGVYEDGMISYVNQKPPQGKYRVLVSFIEPIEGDDTSILKHFQSIQLQSQLGLSSREYQILQLMHEGKRNKDIAEILDIGEGTVRNHVSCVLRKLNARNRTEAVYKAIETGLL
jgi:DNA-binding NarL/FixJ family response regulator